MSQHHTPQFLDGQRKSLVDLRQKMSDSVRPIGAHDRTEGKDVGDQGAADERANFDFLLNEISFDNMREIDAALARIKLGTYGVCELTGDLIPIERLKVLPFARFTTQAQASFERNRAGRQRQVGLEFDHKVEP